MEGMANAIDHIEKHLTQEITMEEIAQRACVSSYKIQKIFSALCGISVGEYIRSRRLALAGSEVLATENKVIDIALKYGYDSPDSFTKAFTRFHGITPQKLRKNGGPVKDFAPLMIELTLKGGVKMDYKIMEKEAFTLMGRGKRIDYKENTKQIPDFWTEHYEKGYGKEVCGVYGVCLEGGNPESFYYMIADDYKPYKEVAEGFETRVITQGTWAVFPCVGPMPGKIQEVTKEIFSQWLPNQLMYEMAGDYNIELYDNPESFPKGNQDENYYSEVWIPVRKK